MPGLIIVDDKDQALEKANAFLDISINNLRAVADRAAWNLEISRIRRKSQGPQAA